MKMNKGGQQSTIMNAPSSSSFDAANTAVAAVLMTVAGATTLKTTTKINLLLFLSYLILIFSPTIFLYVIIFQQYHCCA